MITTSAVYTKTGYEKFLNQKNHGVVEALILLCGCVCVYVCIYFSYLCHSFLFFSKCALFAFLRLMGGRSHRRENAVR
jgi:hypothetical protein